MKYEVYALYYYNSVTIIGIIFSFVVLRTVAVVSFMIMIFYSRDF
jgi:hypothetical protein